MPVKKSLPIENSELVLDKKSYPKSKGLFKSLQKFYKRKYISCGLAKYFTMFYMMYGVSEERATAVLFAIT